MHGPEQRNRQPGQQRVRAEAAAQGRLQERAAHDAKEHQRRAGMNQQIHSVIAADRQAAHRVVEGERKIDDRTPADRHACFVRRRQHRTERPEVTNAGVLGNRGDVIENKGTRETGMIGCEDGENDESSGEKDCAAGWRTRRLSSLGRDAHGKMSAGNRRHDKLPGSVSRASDTVEDGLRLSKTLECGDLAPLSAARLGTSIGKSDELKFAVKSGAWSPHSRAAAPGVQGYE